MRGVEYKCKVFKRHLKLRVKLLETITYIHTLLYKNLAVNTNQKSITDIHTNKKKEYKYNTKYKVIKSQEKGTKEERGEIPTKTNPKQLTKWQ